MFKSTLFIAVKCCECATMQVKQQKKSSNKWNCVVCNQKQSVTKIYAQGYQAKDIRNVVQSFNMSRKLEDDQLQSQIPSLSPFVEHEGVKEVGENCKGKRRTDWSEYVDYDDNVEPAYLKSKHIGKEMVDEEKVVTELSEDSMFKKPRLKGNFGSGNNTSYKPNFSKRGGLTKEIKEGSSTVTSVWDECIVDDSDPIRDVSRRHCKQQGQQKQQNKVLAQMRRGTSKQYLYTAIKEFSGDIGTHSELQKQQPPNKRMAMMKAASKWSQYMAEEDDDDDDDDDGDKEVRTSAFADDLRFVHGYKPENDDVDQLIEEEIHPDFM